MSLPSPSFEILVAGGGTAALCAALAAAERGARVMLVEQAPRSLRGGNTRHSRNLRLAHDRPGPLFPERYDEDEFLAEVNRAAQGGNDPRLARLVVEHSAGLPDWFARHGVAFQEVGCRGLPWSRRTAFFLGGGLAMLNTLYAVAEARGIAIRYDTEVRGIGRDGRVRLTGPEGAEEIRVPALIVASGGYQGDRERLRLGWGRVADALINRGTPYAMGRPLVALWGLGAARSGAAGTAPLIAVDPRGPAADGGILTRVDGLTRALVVDRDGHRFTEEAEITGQTRYSTWGRLVAAQPDGLAFALFDSAAVKAGPVVSIYPPISTPGMATLARQLGIDPAILMRSATEVPGRLARPPFHAVPIRPGITVTCEGVAIDTRARVLDGAGQPMPGLFAAGMAVAPSILGTGYLAGMGMTMGAVTGRLAGEEAARHVGH